MCYYIFSIGGKFQPVKINRATHSYSSHCSYALLTHAILEQPKLTWSSQHTGGRFGGSGGSEGEISSEPTAVSLHRGGGGRPVGL